MRSTKFATKFAIRVGVWVRVSVRCWVFSSVFGSFLYFPSHNTGSTRGPRATHFPDFHTLC